MDLLIGGRQGRRLPRTNSIVKSFILRRSCGAPFWENRMFGQTFEYSDLAVVALLIVLEGILSIDNALVLVYWPNAFRKANAIEPSCMAW